MDGSVHLVAGKASKGTGHATGQSNHVVQDNMAKRKLQKVDGVLAETTFQNKVRIIQKEIIPDYSCDTGSGSMCKTCKKKEFRKAKDHCHSCNRGYYVDGTECVPFSVGQEVEYTNGDKPWKAGVVQSINPVVVKGKGNKFAKKYAGVIPAKKKGVIPA